jgi:hypothetical protein
LALNLYVQHRLQYWALASAISSELRDECGVGTGDTPDDAPIRALNLANILTDRLGKLDEIMAMGLALGLPEEQVRETAHRIE